MERRSIRRLAGLLGAVLLWGQATAQAAVTSLRVSTSPTKVRVVLDLDAPVTYKEDVDGTTLRLDLDTKTLKKFSQTPKDKAVRSLTVLPRGRDKCRLEVDLTKAGQHRVLLLKKPDRLVLDLYRIQIIRETRELGQGLQYTYWQDDMDGKVVRLYALTLAPDSAYFVKPFSAALDRNGRGRLSKAVQGAGARAAVNACYFDTDGWVIGNCKWDGEFFGGDSTPRSALGMDAAGRWQVLRDLSYSGTVRAGAGTALAVTGVNRQRLAQDLIVYNRYYGPSTRTNAFGRDIKVKEGRVTAVSTQGNMALEPGALVLSAHGAKADALAGLRPGDRVTVTQTLGNHAADLLRMVVGAGPSLVEDGTINVRSAQEQMAPDIANGRAPRTGAGVKADGSLILMVVDGRSQYSAGMTLKEFAWYLRRFGARDAVNFDGGGSSELVLDGVVRNQPSDGQERPVSIALGVFRK